MCKACQLGYLSITYTRDPMDLQLTAPESAQNGEAPEIAIDMNQE
jgi:hypothetical protein